LNEKYNSSANPERNFFTADRVIAVIPDKSGAAGRDPESTGI
jgi:hypothetical protein